jgi:hypothetical protein
MFENWNVECGVSSVGWQRVTGCGFRSHMSDAEAWHQVEELDSGLPGANAAPAVSVTRRVNAHASRTARWLCCGPAARSSAIVQNSPPPSLKWKLFIACSSAGCSRSRMRVVAECSIGHSTFSESAQRPPAGTDYTD